MREIPVLLLYNFAGAVCNRKLYSPVLSCTHHGKIPAEKSGFVCFAPNEVTFKQDLVTCAALYAAVPGLYKPENKDGSATSFRQELTGNDIK